MKLKIIKAKALLVGLVMFLLSAPSQAYLWTEAIPHEIHILPHGLVLIGEFENTEVICASGPKAIFLPNSDRSFKEKLSLALAAKATQQKIRVLINDPVESNCIYIPMLGYIPVADAYFWQMKD